MTKVERQPMGTFTPVLVGVIVVVFLGLLAAKTYGEYEALNRRIEHETQQQQREAQKRQREFDRAMNELNDSERELRRELRKMSRPRKR